MNKHPKYLEEIKKISSVIGKFPDLVQGGGGNMSIKINKSEMIIKASGLTLKEANINNGFVMVNFSNVKNYYDLLNLNRKINFETDSLKLVLANTKNIHNLNLRPSMETGFHSFLKKYVIHTHSVYANILNCSNEGEIFLPKIFNNNIESILFVPYVTPGFYLTLAVKQKVEDFKNKFGLIPEIIFLQNHGLIVTSHNLDTCLKLQEFIDSSIKKYFKIKDNYPRPKIISSKGLFHSDTNYLKQFFKKHRNQKKYFNRKLFPDQVVYLGKNLSYITDTSLNLKNKINLNLETGNVIYSASRSESQAIEETLLAYAFIIENLDMLKLVPRSISSKSASYLSNMDSEKHRREIIRTV